MAPEAENTNASGINRREAIRRAALLAGVVLSPRWLTVVDGATPLAQARYLTPTQFAAASAIVDRIIPRTDTPGAADVGVPAFLDLFYGEYMSDAERETLAKGLADVDAAAKSTHGTLFSTLAAERQDALLTGIARAEEGRDGGFFALMRSATILGYFTSEDVGRNVLNYDPVPGRHEPCIPIDQVGRRNWTT